MAITLFLRKPGVPLDNNVCERALKKAILNRKNSLFFKTRYPRFVYVDRIAVAASARGAGLARTLYNDLFRAAREAGHGQIVCEVNIDPPNPASDSFHARPGFSEVGRAELGNGKQVRYLRAPI